MLRAVLTTLAELLGMCAVSAGFGLIWLPLGLISVGICLVLIGLVNA